MSCPDFGDATCFCDMCENFVVPAAYMSDRCKKCHDRIWAELQEENKTPMCVKCNLNPQDFPGADDCSSCYRKWKMDVYYQSKKDAAQSKKYWDMQNKMKTQCMIMDD